MANFEDLRSCLIPPSDPIGTGSPAEWAALEARIRISLPSDYKEFVSTYGCGAIEREVYVLNPFAEVARPRDLETEIARQYDVHDLNVREDFSLAVFDARRNYIGEEQMPAGLIPWGGDASGGTAFWETTDPDPERWTMYIFDGSSVTRYRENLTTFLVNALRGRDTPMFWPDWSCPARYISWA